MKLKQFAVAGLSVFGLLLGGCAATGERPAESGFKGEEAAVAARAESRWATLAKQDMDGAWRFISPAGQIAFPLELYKSRIKPLKWKGAKVIKLDCKDERCGVTLMLSLDDPRTGPLETVITEVWVKQDGQWWFVYAG